MHLIFYQNKIGSVTDISPLLIIGQLQSLRMIGETEVKRTKNFKDIKKSIISTIPSQNQNLKDFNLEEGIQPSLSFKKIPTNREQDSTFTSPAKVLTIDAHPIEKIDFSSQKKKQLFLKYKPSNYEPKQPMKAELTRNDSTKSNKSEGSNKKGLYSQFSQLAQASSQQKKKICGNQLCFNNLQRKPSNGFNQNPKRPNVGIFARPISTNGDKENIVKQTKQTKLIPYKTQTLTPKLRKMSSDPTTVEIKKQRKSALFCGKSNQKSVNPPTIRQLSKQVFKDIQKQVIAPYVMIPPSIQQFVVERKQSNQTIADQVRVSVEESDSINIQLDMSPYI